MSLIDKQFFLDCMMDLAAAFPSVAINERTLTVYWNALKDHATGPVLRKSVNNLITNSQWFPTVARIRDECAAVDGRNRIPYVDENPEMKTAYSERYGKD